MVIFHSYVSLPEGRNNRVFVNICASSGAVELLGTVPFVAGVTGTGLTGFVSLPESRRTWKSTTNSKPTTEFAWGYNSWVIVTMIHWKLLECVCQIRNAAPIFGHLTRENIDEPVD